MKKIKEQAKKIKEQDCIPVGCVPSACYPYLPACTVPGGVCSWGGLLMGWMSAPKGIVCSHVGGVPGPGPRGMSAPGRCLLWGRFAPRGPASVPGGCIPAYNGADPPCEQNDRQMQKNYLAPNFVCGR